MADSWLVIIVWRISDSDLILFPSVSWSFSWGATLSPTMVQIGRQSFAAKRSMESISSQMTPAVRPTTARSGRIPGATTSKAWWLSLADEDSHGEWWYRMLCKFHTFLKIGFNQDTYWLLWHSCGSFPLDDFCSVQMWPCLWTRMTHTVAQLLQLHPPGLST